MKAILRSYRQAPRKVRLVANLIRGKSVTAARDTLSFLPKKSSEAMKKLLESAVSNARSRGENTDTLVVSRITVDKGATLRRFKPMARGRAATFRRTRSIIVLELGAGKPGKVKPAKKVKTETK